MRTFQHLLVGGRWSKPATEDRLTIHSPATGDLIGEAPETSALDVDRAVAEARKAFDDGRWVDRSVEDRAASLKTVRDAIASRIDELDVLATQENGIPISVQPTASALAVLDYYLDIALSYPFVEERRGRFGSRGTILREPVGVVAAVVPWNGPMLQTFGKLAPALLSGCTVVLKPAPETPLTSLALAEAFAEAELPQGVVSILPGGRDVGQHLVSRPGVDKVSFTGSSAAGREIAAACGRELKRVTLELGGKSAGIVLDDAEPVAAAQLMALGCMVYSGQACSALTRALVPASRYSEMVEALTTAVGELPFGDPMDRQTVVGPLVSKQQKLRVERLIASGIDAGAKLICGSDTSKGSSRGCYVEPTVFAEVDNGMRIAQEEIFGPVLCVIPYSNVDEAVAIANDSPYGLSGAVFGQDEKRMTYVGRRLRTGSIGMNALAGDVGLPSGGVKWSGVGREFSEEAFDEYTELKTMARLESTSFGLMGREAV